MTGSDVVKKALSYEGKKGLDFCKAYGYKKTVDWCVIFIWYIFKELKISKLLYDGYKVNNVGVLDNWLKAMCKKVSIKNALPGDLVIQRWDGYDRAHAGIVVKSLGTSKIETIEGNAGYEACTKTVVTKAVRSSGNIYAIYRPNYSYINNTTASKKININELVKGVFSGEYGTGVTRKKKLGDNYDKVQSEVNRILKIVTDVMTGKYGNGATRKKKLGKDYDIVQWYINNCIKKEKNKK